MHPFFFLLSIVYTLQCALLLVNVYYLLGHMSIFFYIICIGVSFAWMGQNWLLYKIFKRYQ